MNGDFKTPVNRDALLETFAAELTLAASRVALRTRTQGTWLDLELEAIRETPVNRTEDTDHKGVASARGPIRVGAMQLLLDHGLVPRIVAISG
jgi:hypothetical protein